MLSGECRRDVELCTERVDLVQSSGFGVERICNRFQGWRFRVKGAGFRV